MNNLHELIYNNSPVFVQNMLLSAHGARLKKERFCEEYYKMQQFLEASQWKTQEQLVEYQNQELGKLIQHAYNTVPYYNKIMQERKLTPSDIKTVQDLVKLPVLSKKLIRENFSDLASTSYKKENLKLGHSSGTTGSPHKILWDEGVEIAHNVALWRHRTWAGFEFGAPFATMLGRIIVPEKQKKPPFYRYNKPWNSLFLSSFHMQEENLESYVDALQKYGVRAINAYPSTAFILAKYLEQKGKTIPLDCVFTTSETLLRIQRETIEKSFQCKVFDYYGLSERTVFAGECREHNGHHIHMEYGICELIKDNDESAAPGEYWRMVTTGLHNYAMPLIRYELGDVSTFKSGACPCGRGLQQLEPITTKAEDIVITKDGRFISSSVLTHPFKPLYNIEKSQIIQESISELTIKIVKKEGYQDKDTQHLLTEMHRRLGADMNIKIEFVADIPLSARGKYRWVISKVPLEFKKAVFKNLYTDNL